MMKFQLFAMCQTPGEAGAAGIGGPMLTVLPEVVPAAASPGEGVRMADDATVKGWMATPEIWVDSANGRSITVGVRLTVVDLTKS